MRRLEEKYQRDSIEFAMPQKTWEMFYVETVMFICNNYEQAMCHTSLPIFMIALINNGS